MQNDGKQHYRAHIFCCVNQREPDHPRSCCAARGSVPLHKYMKQRAKELEIQNIRVNQSGCLERCELGPAMVIYPEGVWYTYQTPEDVDEILTRHVVAGQRVERLMLRPGQILPDEKPITPIEVRIAAVRRETDEISRYELRADMAARLPRFQAGAHIDVLTGNGRRCSYSLLNDPKDKDRYEIGVLKERESRGGSKWIHDELKVDDRIRIMPPINNFRLSGDARRHVMIAGGIGITPLLSMGHALRREGADFFLHYCTRTPESTAFSEDVKAVFGERVAFYHDGGDPSRGIDLAAVLGSRQAGDHLYICGPASLLDAARTAASEWPATAVHFERFEGRQQFDTASNETFEISLSRHKMQLSVPPDKSILDVIRENGVYIDSSCEQGICSTCKVGLLSGTPEHRDDVLTDAEKAANDAILVCVSRARQGELLVLDL